jgi:hypothetical protein
MKDTITTYQFSNEMIEHGFSYEGAKALFEYFEQYEQDTVICKWNLIPVAIRCDFDEYESLEDVKVKTIKTLKHLKICKTIQQLLRYRTAID